MPSYLDIGLISIVLVSAMLAMLRGFTREVMAILSWGAAAAAAIYFYPLLVPKLAEAGSPIFIAKDQLRPYIAGAAIFFLTLILVSIITIRLSNAILDSKIGALDRTFGFVFGAVRGLLLCAIAFIFFNWLAPEGARKDWIATAKSRALLQATGDQLLALLPDDPDGIISKLRKPKPATSDEAPPAETDQEPKAAPVTPSPPVRKKADSPAVAPNEKQKLNNLLNGGAR